MQIEDDLEASSQNKGIKVIDLGKIGGEYQDIEKSQTTYKFSQKVIEQVKEIDAKDFDLWIDKIANQ